MHNKETLRFVGYDRKKVGAASIAIELLAHALTAPP
jgi:hypothetical protein